ncbi:hypothetical protein [Actinomadura xylanilytica]|uniref:hypothetical protein n=1 Tax=Actinomadura xylanilytica TaxID=887459 RepID=UPI00255AAADA|nr:hypothetical protein [Actinomadura xylanilytica]MDL4773626.1 hypothetical protein [Actinomadura xylanilytica]
MVKDLIALAVELTWFFESCDDGDLNSDGAVRQMEWIAHVLGQQNRDDRALILTVVREMAAKEQRPGAREFLETFPENMGLLETTLAEAAQAAGRANGASAALDHQGRVRASVRGRQACGGRGDE